MISVVVPACNAADTIGAQLDALLGQTYEGDWEVIVADNGSTDATRLNAERYLERTSRVRLVDASARRGAASPVRLVLAAS